MASRNETLHVNVNNVLTIAACARKGECKNSVVFTLE